MELGPNSARLSAKRSSTNCFSCFEAKSPVNKSPLLALTVLSSLAVLFSLAITQTAYSQGEKVPESAFLGVADLKLGEQEIVCRASIVRKFMGTRANPPYWDTVEFYCFDGKKLQFSTVEDPNLRALFMEQLTGGHSLPVLLTVDVKSVRVGHDGINMSQRMVPNVVEYQPLTIEAIKAAAKAAGLDDAVANSFEQSLSPDGEADGVAVSLGNIFIRSKANRSGSGLGIAGIQVFNSNSEEATIKINRVWSQQGDQTQEYELTKRSAGPLKWTVASESWSDGVYTDGKMPKNLWQFKPSTPLEPEQEVILNFEIQVNDGEPMTLTRTAEPI